MKEILSTWLQPLSGFFYDLVMLVPLTAVKWIFLGSLLLLMVWVWRLPGEAPGDRSGLVARIGRDLRVWASGILLLQILIYLLLG